MMLKRWATGLIAFSAVLLLAQGCFPASEALPERPEPRTSSSSRLYFQNVRSVFYQSEAWPDAGVNVYRLKTADAQPREFHLAIANNWRLDKAVLVIELSDALARFAPVAFGVQRAQRPSAEQPFVFGHPDDHAAFGVALYEALETSMPLALRNEAGEAHVVTWSQEEARRWRRVLRDYFELIDAI